MKVALVVLLLFSFAVSIQCKTIIRSIIGKPNFGGDGFLATKAVLNNLDGGGFYATQKREVFIADTQNHAIRKVDRNGIISTVAGIPGEPGTSFIFDRPALEANLYVPKHVYVSNKDELFIAITHYHIIHKVFPNGTMTVFAGNEHGVRRDNIPATLATLKHPTQITMYNEELYFCEETGFTIRKVDKHGNISTVVGQLDQSGYVDGPASQAMLVRPTSFAISETTGVMFIADSGRIRRVALDNGTVTTYAGTGNNFPDGSLCNYKIDPVRDALNFSFCSLKYIALVPETDSELMVINHDYINKIFSNRTIITYAGVTKNTVSNIGPLNTYSGDDGPYVNATFEDPSCIGFNYKSELLISDRGAIRIINRDGIIRRFAGNLAKPAILVPSGLQLTQSNVLYVADREGHKVFTIKDGIMTVIMGNGGTLATQDGVPATNTSVAFPSYFAVNQSSNEVFIRDSLGSRIRKLLNNGTLTTVIGTGFRGYNGDGPGLQVATSGYGMLQVVKDDLYYCDPEFSMVRKWNAINGTVTTIAGRVLNGEIPFEGDGQDAKFATFKEPRYLFYKESSQELYITDNYYYYYYPYFYPYYGVVRKIFSNGTITTVYRDTQSYPIVSTCYVTEENDIYVGTSQSLIKVLANGTIVTVAGRIGVAGFSGDEGDPTKALFSSIFSLVVANTSTFYIADTGNRVVRKIQTLCDQVDVNASMSITQDTTTNQIQFLSQAKRTCTTNPDYLLANYPPLVTAKYKATPMEDTVYVADWNSDNYLTPIQGRELDLLSISLDGCNSKEFVTTNCSNVIEYGVQPYVPTFVVNPNIISMEVVISYQITSFVSQVQTVIEVFNQNTNQVENTVTEIGATRTSHLTNLKHSTNYQLRISTTVLYTNQLAIKSSQMIQHATTKLGLAPSQSVQNIIIVPDAQDLVATWKEVPENARGNLLIDHLEIQLSSQTIPTSTISIAYNAEDNYPSGYLFNETVLIPNVEYQISIRSCNPIGCSSPSQLISATLQKVSESSLIASILSPIASIILLLLFVSCGILLITVLLVAITVIIASKKAKPKATLVQELVEELVSKEFRIEEDKIDTSNSIFLGSGASGSVITAKYFNIDVAVKIIQKSIAGLDNDLTDFYNELQFLNSNTQHGNIIRFFGVYESKEYNRIGLVMECCSNGSLAGYISKHTLIFKQKLSFLLGIANGMAYLHFHNIAHRDLKCENVLLDSSLVPKIIDFGFSRVIAEEANKSMNLTMNVGTAVYCAPEVFKSQFSTMSFDNPNNDSSKLGSNTPSMHSTSTTSSSKFAYDKKCDIYSFAIIIWVVYFQNNHPYGENCNPNQIVLQMTQKVDFRPPIHNEAALPENEKWLLELMKQCWSTNPEERPSFEQICKILEEHLLSLT